MLKRMIAGLLCIVLTVLSLFSVAESGVSSESNQRKNGGINWVCPYCKATLELQEGFSPDIEVWTCRSCGRMIDRPTPEEEAFNPVEAFQNARFPGIYWYCDKCGAFLNIQNGFDDHLDEWKCEACGLINAITYENIIGNNSDRQESQVESEVNEREGFWGSIGDFFSDVRDGVSSAADDAGKWVSGAANDAGHWIEGAANDVANWAEGAYNDTTHWVGNATDVAGKWISSTAIGAWDWTKATANSSWIWAQTTAENAWNVTSKTVSGTWESVFGKGDNNKGPHNLCVSSPLFEQTESLSSKIDENGYVIQCFKYDEDYDITLIATARAEEIMPPSVGEMDFSELVKFCYDDIDFKEQNVVGLGDRAMAQELRFKAALDGIPKFGRALGVWTDHYIVAFFITVNVTTDGEVVDEEVMKENDAVFDLWVETLSVSETNKYELDVTAGAKEDTNAGNMTASNVKISNRLFKEATFHSKYGGKGFAAEEANTLADNIKGVFNGQKAKVIGYDNAPNGADRLVTDKNGNDFWIQSKYYQTARGSINACFDADGVFKYVLSDGTPMQIEVASDQYDDAVSIMRQYISEGRIPTVSDPEDATKIVRKGTVTYKQACRIAKAGNIDSLVYDSVNASVESLYSIGISSAIQFATQVWNGEDIKKALKVSVFTGLKVGGTNFVISVFSSQLSKAGLNSLLVGSSEAIVEAIGPKAAARLVNAFRTGSEIYGAAAMRSAAKLLRGNAITSAVTLVISTVPDVIDIFYGRISVKQLMKNLAQTGGGIAGGFGGWYGGATLGSLIAPGIGTFVGGIIGSVGGGYIVQFVTGKVTDLFAEDDAEEMIDIVAKECEKMVNEYLLNEEEIKAVIDNIKKCFDVNGDVLKNMFASANRELFAREVILRPCFNEVIEKRNDIQIPSYEAYQEEVKNALEDIEEEEEMMEEAA